MSGVRLQPAETTHTESLERPSASADTLLGVQWVWPRTHFHTFAAQAMAGRAETCALRLDSTQVSREHAVLQREGPLWVLRDLGSKNGSWVNARRQELASLNEQDVLRIGDHVGIVCALPRAAVERGAVFETLLPGALLSAATAARLEALPALATRGLPVLVTGETGTGKELVVRALHERSGRGGPLVAVNCAAVPEGMAEDLMFGHRKGAFTGAQSSTDGYVRAAQGGTLFLDEVADLPLALQAKLLRVLEQRAVTPLGSSESVAVDFRLVAACQSPLEGQVAAGAFRADLYARVRGAELHLPPLRARRQEIVALLSGFLAQHGDYQPELEPRLVEALCAYDWPYNVRELKQLARVFEASRKPRLGLLDLPESLREPAALEAPIDESTPKLGVSSRRQAWLLRHRSELERLRAALRQHHGNVSLAASDAGVPRHRARRLLAAAAEPRETAERKGTGEYPDAHE